MAKNSLLMGKQSGKLGQSVLSVRYGEQIMRAYVGTIANPKTEAQVATRSRFKLASQLSAVMADVIAIPRVGSKTGRNQFVSATMDITSEAAGVAQVNLNAVQLTKSQRGLIGFTATRDTANNKISVALKGANGTELSRVVYVVFEKQNDGSLVQLASQVVSEAGANSTFPAELKGSSKSVVIYAYGITDKDGAASVKFGNLNAPTAEQVAKLLTTSSDTLSGVTLTKTNGATMNEGVNSADSDDNVIPTDMAFASVTLNGAALNANLSNQTKGNKTFAGSIINPSENTKVAVVNDYTSVPSVGSEYTPVSAAWDLNAQGAFSGTYDAQGDGDILYLVAGTMNGTKIVVEKVYQYSVGIVDES